MSDIALTDRKTKIPATTGALGRRLFGKLSIAFLGGVLLLLVQSGPADAALASVNVLPSAALKESVLEQPILAARKGKVRKRKKMRRKAHQRNRLRKKRKEKQHGRKPDRDRPNKDRPNKDKPDKDRPNTQTTDTRTPDRRPGNLVCIGGRVKAGKCRCRRANIRRHLGKTVFGCAPAGKPVILPVASQQPPASSPTPPAAQASTPAASTSAGNDFVPDEVLVTLDPESSLNVENAVAQSYGLQVSGRWILELLDTRLVRFRIPDGRPVPQVIAAMAGDARVISPQPNFYYRPQTGSSTVAPAELQYALAKVGVTSAHKIANGRGTRIAILDSVVDGTHPDLAGAVEDTFDVSGKGKRASDDHGTAIAGIIRARGMLRGVAPEATLLSVGVYEQSAADGSAAATTSNLLRGLDWALARRANVINMSLAGPADSLLEQGVTAMSSNNAVIVAAAGNGGAEAPPAYPAAYETVIAVTAIDVADRLYASANRGAYIAIAAPGVDILTPGLDHAHQLQTGTSFAAAHVSGIVALLLDRNPKLSNKRIRRALTKAAGDLGVPGRDDEYGAGRANAFRSLSILGQSGLARQ